VPIVLHGASGLSAKDIETAIKLGVKRSTSTPDIRQAFTDGIKEVFAQHPEEIDPARSADLQETK
jgi:fructose-bisphosphate aldolase class II